MKSVILFWMLALLGLQAHHAAAARPPDDAVGLQRQHFLIVPTAVSTSESLDALHVLAELAARGHACTVVSMEPITSFYQTTLAGFYNQSALDKGKTPAEHAPCRFITYPDTLQGGAAHQLQATLSGSKKGGGGVERHNPLKLLGRMNLWLNRRCRAMLFDPGVRRALLLEQQQQQQHFGAEAQATCGASSHGGAAGSEPGTDLQQEPGGRRLQEDRVDAQEVREPAAEGKPEQLPPVSAVLVSYPDQCSCAVANLLGAPLVEANGNPWVTGPLSVPQFMSGLSPHQLRSSFLARARNFAQWALMHAMPYALPRGRWRSLRSELGLPRDTQEIGLAAAAAGRTCHPLEPRVRLLSMELEFPRPIPQGQVVVGTISARPGRPIADPRLAAFVEGASGGLVLAGFGSTTVYGRSLGARDFVELARAFSQLGELRLQGPGAAGGGIDGRDGGGGGGGGSDGPSGVRVLWGVRDSSLPEGLSLSDLPIGDNTYVTSWYPDNDVLSHPNTKAFVSHLGLHSLYGGAFHGVPLVALPFTKEQLDNAVKGQARGMLVACSEAPVLAPKGQPRCSGDEGGGGGRRDEGGGGDEVGCVHIQAERVVESVKEVLLNGSYAAAARAVGRVMQARYRIRPPLLMAADEVELAVMMAAELAP